MADAKDNEAFFDAEIAPLMAQIMDLCKSREVPLVASFEIAAQQMCSYVFFPPDTQITQSLMVMGSVLYPEMFVAVVVPEAKGNA